MNLLVTAGNTQVLIDQVRCLTNIFTGRTGAGIALAATVRGHCVTLLTSHPDTISPLQSWEERGRVGAYRTFDELQTLMAQHIAGGGYDAVIHAAAVSDYLAAGVYAPAPATSFTTERAWTSQQGAPTMLDCSAGKIKSDQPELWLRLTRAPKLVDRIRTDWSFRGALVKFKLEVGVSEAQLLEIAERSRRHSQADWMVANTLDAAADWAFMGPFADGYHRLSRQELPAKLIETLEAAIPDAAARRR